VSGACCNKAAPTLTYAVGSTIETANTLGSGSFTGTFSYVQNPTSINYKVLVCCEISSATFSISGSTMNVTIFDTTQYPLKVGQYMFAPGMTGLVSITALGTGTGGAGTYTIDTPQTLASVAGASLYKYYNSPTTINSGSSPETFTVTSLDFGGVNIEPNTGYFFGIQMTVICGSTQTVVNSNWGYSQTASFATGQNPLNGPDEASAGGFPHSLVDTLRIYNVSELWATEPPATYTDPTVQIYVSQWSLNNPALMGILDGTFVSRTVPYQTGVGGGGLVPGWIYNYGGSGSSGETMYTGFKAWGPTSFYNWQLFTVVHP